MSEGISQRRTMRSIAASGTLAGRDSFSGSQRLDRHLDVDDFYLGAVVVRQAFNGRRWREMLVAFQTNDPPFAKLLASSFSRLLNHLPLRFVMADFELFAQIVQAHDRERFCMFANPCVLSGTRNPTHDNHLAMCVIVGFDVRVPAC